MYCAACGGENPDDARYCGHCSRPLTSGSQQEAPKPPPLPVDLAGAPPAPSADQQSVPYTCAVCGYILGPFEGVCARCQTPRGMRVDPNAPVPGTYTQAGGVVPDNTSGMRSTVPLELQGKWNWGGCTMGCLWSASMRMWQWAVLALLGNVLCGLIGIGVAIYLGIKGNELAWQNRRFDSIEQFRAVQRLWAIWGISVTVVFVVLYAMIIALGLMRGI